MPGTRSGKSYDYPNESDDEHLQNDNFELSNNSELKTIHDGQYDSCNSIPIVFNQHRPPIPVERDGDCVDDKKLQLECEILQEEIEIQMKQLELKKKRLRLSGRPLPRAEQASSYYDSRAKAGEGTSSVSPSAKNSQCDRVQESPDELHDSAQLARPRPTIRVDGLPRIDIDKFDGDPLKFCRFIKIFQMNIADQLTDDRQRLMYLMQYCSGDAKEAIEQCVFLPDGVGYQKAMSILASQFGRSHDIVQSFMSNLLNGERIASNDVDGIRKLARQMTSCELALCQLNQSAELNCSTTLKSIVERLPKLLCHKWAERANDLLCLGKQPSFSDLTEFLEKHVAVATSCYGYIASRGKPTGQQPNGRSSVFFTNTTTRCPQCTGSHTLQNCSVFTSLPQSGKLEFVKEHKLCFNCFLPNHRAFNCRNPSRCNSAGCGQKHHNSLHFVSSNPKVGSDAVINSMQHQSIRCFLGFVAVRIVGPNGTVETYALLDNGSDSTLLSKNLAERLGIVGDRTRIQVTSVHGTSSRETDVVSFSLESLHDGTVISVDQAYTVDSLPVAAASVPDTTRIKEWPHLADIKPVRLNNPEVSILVGTNVPEAHWITAQRRGSPKQPYACLTTLGWTILGPTINGVSKSTVINLLTSRGDIDNDINRMFEAEFSENGPDKALSVEDRGVLKRTTDNVRLLDGHYEVPAPWKVDWKTLPSNRIIAEKRLIFLKRRLCNNPQLLQQYREIIIDYELKNYVSRVQNTDSKHLRFLPHHPVFNPRKPGKVRIVFDAAAKGGGISLNDCLNTGPDLTNDLTGVLLRFRQHTIAMSADIQEMFLQVRLPMKDRGAFSFLWYPDGDLQRQPSVYQLNVHPFGATSSPFCAAFALRCTAEDNLSKFDPAVTTALKRNFYVDDCLVSVETIGEAVKLVKGLRQLLSLGGFRLHKWICNEGRVLSEIPESERTSQSVDLNISGSTMHKTLGLCWLVEEDCFNFTVDLPQKPATKRGVLSVVASLYDPMGFVAPLLLTPKKLLQELCRRKQGWDDELDNEAQSVWEKWKRSIKQLSSLKIPRCVKSFSLITNQTSLHLFSDASESGYGAVAYLRCVSEEGGVSCRILLGKSRVAPLKPVTIPRLELQAAVLSVRLMCQIRREVDLNIAEFYFWTDSTIVLHYIGNTKSRFKTFVANRIGFIHDNTQVAQWRHVPTKENPADFASRGIEMRQQVQLASWLSGPDFLMYPECTWPKLDIEQLNGDICGAEIRKEVTIFSTDATKTAMDDLIFFYSSWPRLVSGAAWMIRFKKYLIQKTRKSGPVMSSTPLQLCELKAAELDLIRYVQRKSFPEIFKSGQVNTMPPKNHSLRKLSPIIIDGLLRVGGRLELSVSAFYVKHPIILPARHHLTEILINHFHLIEGHMGSSHVLARLRHCYWLVKGTSAVKRVINKCLKCKMNSAKPAEQIMAQLPECRVTIGRPFSATGVDFFGPFFVRERRSAIKRYGCIFSCLRTRAIHLEVAYSLSIDSFLMALTRFVSRRGRPDEVYSDQGSNFVGVELELRKFPELMNTEKVIRDMNSRGIVWHFNPPYSSHRGGIWERQIRSVRRILSSISREQVLTDESLATFLCEAERIMNNRPLTPLSDSPDELEVLTPSHLLLLNRPNEELPLRAVDIRSRYSRFWRQGQVLADAFWRRWLKEYLPLLQLRHKWVRKRRDFCVGDFVLYDNENAGRGTWNKAIVAQVIEGSDKRVRQVILKTADAEIRRDIRRVCLIEGIEAQ